MANSKSAVIAGAILGLVFSANHAQAYSPTEIDEQPVVSKPRPGKERRPNLYNSYSGA